ncbi:hypothetical protein LI291_16920, partial [Intestinibacillus massiliensis]|nr:hypothetical protein [Intestinibacillus massiliensis]
MSILPKSAYEIKLPKMCPVTQLFPNEKLADIRGSVDREFEKEHFRAAIRPGQSIAVLVGSRGISNLAEIVRA